MHMFAVIGHPDQPHFTLPPPHHAPAPPVKKKFSLQLPVRNDGRVRPKEMLMKLLQNYIKLITFCFYCQNTEKVSKANTGESAVKLSEHVAEDSKESHPMFKCT